jgi:CRP/FNR family transcriptional regulator, cyclic AMP receptor protein
LAVAWYDTEQSSVTSRTSNRPKTNGKRAFNAQDFLDSAGIARKVVEFKRKDTVFSQGDVGNNVLYIQKGGVRLSVVNETGKEAVVAVLGPGDFFGEGCLAGQPLRIGTATAITGTTVLVIEKKEMIRVLHVEHAFSDRFITYMLSRNIRIEEDLVDQLFNSSEKRLARTLLLLARYGTQDKPQRVLPKISQEMLAEMVGTTRSRVNFFMNKFRKLGFIKYNGGLQINTSLLSVVLHD